MSKLYKINPLHCNITLMDGFDQMLTTSLSGVYLWIFFGYLSAYMNCDLQRMIVNNTFFLHAFGLITFLFLFTSQTSPRGNIGYKVLHAIIVYCVWLLASKTKWYFICTILAALIVNQGIQYQYDLLIENNMDDNKRESYENIKKRASLGTTIIVLVTTLIGVVHYMYLQKIEYKDEFSFLKFFFGKGRCKARDPDYENDFPTRKK